MKKPNLNSKIQNEIESIIEENDNKIRNVIPTPKTRYNALQPLNETDEKNSHYPKGLKNL